MTDDRDPILQSLFDDAQHNLDGEAFTAQVMAQTHKLKYSVIAGGLVVAIALAASAWLLALPLQELAQLIAQILTTSLVDLGESSAAWVLAPVNNVASLLISSVKAIRVIRKKIIGASYDY